MALVLEFLNRKRVEYYENFNKPEMAKSHLRLLKMNLALKTGLLL
jgi:hypothetical protein